MNPFAWSGPAFLLFYLVLAVGVILACWFRTRHGGNPVAIAQTELTADPYRIAYLRGGAKECVRVAVFNLVDRGLLTHEGTYLSTKRKAAAQELRRNLDRGIAVACEGGRSASRIAEHPKVALACVEYDRELRAKGLLPDAAEKRARLGLMAGALVILIGVAGIKIAVALSAGRSNMGLLVFLTLVACVVSAVVCNPRISASGRAALSSLGTLMNRLKVTATRLKRGGASNEALLLAAIAGLAVLPVESFDFIETIYPRPKPSGGDGGGGGDAGGGGSSCSSSCGGGGGCGGCGSD